MWKKQYAGFGVQALHELPQLRAENSRRRRLLVDVSLDDRSCLRSFQKTLWRKRVSDAGWRGGPWKEIKIGGRGGSAWQAGCLGQCGVKNSEEAELLRGCLREVGATNAGLSRRIHEWIHTSDAAGISALPHLLVGVKSLHGASERQGIRPTRKSKKSGRALYRLAI